MKKRITVYVLMFSMCLMLAACGAGADLGKTKSAEAELQRAATEDIFYTTNGAIAGGAMYDMAPEEPKDSMYAASTTGSSVYRNEAVKLIRRANLTVQTTEFVQTQRALEQLVVRLEGYYESSDLRGGSYYNQQSSRSGSYTIRVPAANYDAFMQQVDGIGYLARKNESTEDVGQAYHDIETRLKTQRTKQERLLELLKRAESMEDIIALENALTEVEYYIEQYTTDLNRYDGLVGYATIHLTLEEMVRIVDEPGEKAGLLARMKAGVISSANGLVEGVQNVIVWFTYNLFGLFITAGAVVAGVFLGKRCVRIRRERKTKKTEQGES